MKFIQQTENNLEVKQLEQILNDGWALENSAGTGGAPQSPLMALMNAMEMDF